MSMQMETLRSTLELLRKSTKVTDRKKASESLVELLTENEEVCRSLNANSVQKDKTNQKITWNTVFQDVKDYFDKETSKMTVGQAGTAGKYYSFSVVNRVFQKGTSSRPWIEWRKIFDLITRSLEQEVYVMVFGAQLLGMLESFLSIELYVSVIEANCWIDLLRLLMKLYTNNKYKLTSYTLTQCINICISEGSNHPTVINVLRSEAINFYTNLFDADRNLYRANLSVLLRGMTTLCRKNAVEFRGILCKFGETLIPRVFPSNLTSDEEQAIVEFLLVQLQIHSPQDVLQSSEGFLADDVQRWTEAVQCMHDFCLETLEEHANKKHTYKDLQLSERLLFLAAKCTWQVTALRPGQLNVADDDDANPAKKRMRQLSFTNIFSNICSNSVPDEKQIVWMNYFTVALTHFPQLIESRVSFNSLLQLGVNFLKSSFVTRRDVYHFFICLLNVERHMISKKTFHAHSIQWETIWDLVIRSLSVCAFKPEALELLRKILVYIQPPNVHQLLLLYTNGSIPVTRSSLNLLAQYLCKCSLPLTLEPTLSSYAALDSELASTICPRSALIRWLLTTKGGTDIQEHRFGYELLIAVILCSLAVRQTHNLISSERSVIEVCSSSEFNQLEPVYEYFESLLLQCCFVRPTCVATSNESPESRAETPGLKLSILPVVTNRLIDMLSEDYETLPNFDYKASDFLKKFVELSYRLSLYLNILNFLEKYFGQVDFGFKTSLEKLFDRAMIRCMENTTDYITKGKTKSPSQVHEVICMLRNVLKNSPTLCDGMKVMVTQRFPQHLQELLKKTYRSNFARYIEKASNNPTDTLLFGSSDIIERFLSGSGSICGEGGVSESRQIELAALESLGCLMDYGIICDHQTELISELLRDCINESYNYNFPFIFEFSSELISRYIPILTSQSAETLRSDMVTIVTNLLQKMCRGFYTNPHCSARLWELFSDVTSVIAKDTDVNKKNLMVLVGTLCSFMNNGKPYGSNIIVCQAGFKALIEIAKNDPEMVWSVYVAKDGSTTWVLNETYAYLSSPSQQIRLLAIETLAATYGFASAPSTAEPVYPTYEPPITTQPLSLDLYFEKIYQSVLKSFQVPSSLTPEETVEEGANRTSMALSCLTRVVFAYPFIQRKTLFSLLQLVKSKSVDVLLCNRALQFASPSTAKTMCCHLSFLLHKWISSNYAIAEFPYQLFGCDSMGTFYSQFRKEISVEFFQKNDSDSLTKFAKLFGVGPLDLVKECYGMLMARIIPGIAIYKLSSQNPTVQGGDIAVLQETQKRLNSFLGGKREIENLMMTKMGDVLLQSVSLVFNPDIPSAWGCPASLRLPEPSSPYFDEESVDTALTFLKDASSRRDVSLIAFLATHNPKSIYDTMLTLVRRIHDAHDLLEKFWRLHQFSYFVKQLLQEPPTIFNHMKEYVCQFVIYAYIRLLNAETGRNKYNRYLRESLVFLLSQLVLNLTMSYKEEMKHHYYVVVNTLIVAATKHSDLIPAIEKTLNILLITYTDDFSECIVGLDPFPVNKVKEFEKYREVYHRVKYGVSSGKTGNVWTDWPLFKELKSCLQGRTETWTLERLIWIRELLANKKRDLERLVKATEGKRFADECLVDVTHALVHTLVNVVKKSPDSEVALEASRCLGEIGPIDLSVQVLPSFRPKRRDVKRVARPLLAILEILIDNLKSEDIQLVTTAGVVLNRLCHNAECVDVITKNCKDLRTNAILKPFKSTGSVLPPSTAEKVIANSLETKLGLNEMNESIIYENWIIQLTCGLIECFKNDDSLIVLLLPICRISVEFCQEVMPFVFYVLLHSGRMNPLVRKTVSSYFRNFFSKCIHVLATAGESSRSVSPILGSQNESSIFTNKLALRSLIGVIQFLRHHPAPQEYKGSTMVTPWDNNFWLEINYFDLAKAAQYCGAYLTSILFVEIAVTELEASSTSHGEDTEDDEMESFYSQGTSLLPNRMHRGESHDKLLLKAYTSIGERDAVYGCGSARFSEGTMNIAHLQQRMQFYRVLSTCDGNSVDPESCIKAGVSGAMKDLALYNSLWTYLRGVESEEKVLDQELAELQYECGWRLSKWNLHCDKAAYLKDASVLESSTTSGMIQRFVYESVQTGLTKDLVNHSENVRHGYSSIVTKLRQASIESSENMYGFLSQFQMLRTVEDFFETESEEGLPGIAQTFVSKWRTHDKINQADFKFQEPILSLRGVLLHSYAERNQKSSLEPPFDETLLDIVAKARDCGRLELAENGVNSICLAHDKNFRKDLEIAKNHWARKDQDIARHILGRIIKKANPDNCDLYPQMLLLYGEWLSVAMNERPSVILEKYFLKSCQIYDKRGPSSQQEAAKAHIVLAKYADDQYQNLGKYMKSEMYMEKIAHLEKARRDIDATAGVADIDVRKSREVMRRQCNIDEEELRSTKDEKMNFLKLALQHYLKGLKENNENDLLVFRAVALWLENAESSDGSLNKEINSIIQSEVLPPYKYVVVLHQLSARLSDTVTVTNSLMLDTIKTILLNCACAHPYHTVPVLLTQSLLHEDQGLTNNSNSKVPARKKQNIEDRVTAATKLVDHLKRNQDLQMLVNKMARLWHALIKLANVQETTKNPNQTNILISNESDIKRLTGLEAVPVPTATIPVIPSGNYGEIVGIKSFEPTYSLVGGINSPKRISCIGTNGVKYNMLLKGQDDLRQDAVMQQVFSVMNKLLQTEPKTRVRRLHVRTYKVVPLSQRTGILEWCENTQTLGDYLAGDNGAHQKYRPLDYKPLDCRSKMLAVRNCGDNEKKYQTFMTILEHFKPVFRHFFFENFKDAGTFFERRLAYTRSVATNSMVGYILGLGDRHVLNILVDKTTAELIHIDLGVAFEQGRILPTPETIPFRLTRDIVDGMGVSGIEGVFRKSCEMALEVLRDNSEIILTILEVLLYDPLYMWTLTADRVRKVQPADSNRPVGKRSSSAFVTSTETVEEAPKERNSSASRVLLRLRQKLAGIEEGGTSATTLNVPGQVSLLIQRAMDPERLSRLFPGWQPYL